MALTKNEPANAPWKLKLYGLIFETDTRAAKVFDLALLVAILMSVAVLMLESVPSIRKEYGTILRIAEWVITGLFTIEYVLRVLAVKRPLHYILSFMGLIDLLSILPTFLSIFIHGPQYLLSIRILRLIRVFRILKLARFVGEQDVLKTALHASRYKITVFVVVVLCIVTVMGTLLFIIEGPENGYTSIPKSVYWAIVTLTTVGYGDISPQTPLGQFMASIIMIMGYGVIAVPTGIVSAELNEARRSLRKPKRECPVCGEDEHLDQARYCHRCGNGLDAA